MTANMTGRRLDFLSDLEKEVFKTFSEIDQYIIINQAATRQQFVDQSQSLNVMINPKSTAKEINRIEDKVEELIKDKKKVNTKIYLNQSSKLIDELREQNEKVSKEIDNLAN